MGGGGAAEHERLDPSAWVTREDFGRALTAAMQDRGLTVRRLASVTGAPAGTVGNWTSGTSAPTVDNPHVDAVLTACGVSGAALPEWKAAINRIRRSSRPVRSTKAPWLGLEFYRSADAAAFYGRDDLAAQLRGFVTEGLAGAGPKVVVVVGASGAGKSSLLHAGLITAFEDAAVAVTPGANPVPRLASAIADADGRELVLVVDQCEELWTYESEHGVGPGGASGSVSAAVRAQFVDRLTELTRSARPVVVVVGLRADFFGQATEYEFFADALRTAQVLVGPMNVAQLREVIVRPAADAGVQVDTPLLELLQAELSVAGMVDGAHDVGALPMLSVALLHAWERRPARRDRLTVADYHEAGGLRGAVEQSAEAVWDELEDRAAQDAARRMFTRSVMIGDAAPLARRVVPRSELVWSDIDSATVDFAVSRFVDARLVTATVSGVQITHEALLHTWPRLRGWIDAGREDLLVHRRITEAAREWSLGERDDDALPSPGRTEEFQRWADAAHRDELNDDEIEFLTVATGHVARRRRRRRQLIGALVAAVLVLLAATGFAVYSRGQAVEAEAVLRAHAQASASYSVRLDRPDVGALLAVASYRANPDMQGRSAVLSLQSDLFAGRLTGHRGAVVAAATGSDRLVTADDGGGLRVWDLTTRSMLGPEVTVGAAGPVGVAMTADQQMFATTSSGAVQVWETTDQPAGRELGGQLSGPRTIALSGDGRYLATISAADRAVQVWDPRTLEQGPAVAGGQFGAGQVAFARNGPALASGGGWAPLRVWPSIEQAPRDFEVRLPDPVDVVAIAPDGSVAAAAGGGAVAWFDVASGQRRSVNTDGSPVRGIDFNPDGSVIAIGADDQIVRVVDTATGRTVSSIKQSASVRQVAFSADGNTLAVTGNDGAITLWDTSAAATLVHHPLGAADAVAYNRAGTAILSTDGDGGVHLWDPRTGQETRQFPGCTHTRAVAFANEDRDLVVAGGKGMFVIDAATGATRQLDPGRTESIAISSDGKTLAAATNRTLRLYDTATWTQLAQTQTGSELLTGVAFSADRRTVIVASYDGAITVYGVDEQRSALVAAATLEVSSIVRAVAMSPDGRHFAVATGDGRTTLYRIGDGQQLDSTTPHRDLTMLSPPGSVAPSSGSVGMVAQPIRSLAFTGDSRQLAGAGDDGTIHLWNTDPTLDDLAAVISSHSNGGVLALTVDTADPSRLLTAGRDGRIRRWSLDTDAVADRACTTAASDPIRWHDLTNLIDTSPC